ncbi:uroporphyrinogen-III synthase [Arthrobacter sp. A2-55]|uniref:uroporphyrinogen-III synthase n=1 Tax=Arthrobacter sp. A2-55 TaxID=2897337 RepID=UPI0021CDB414|nr:uroporphyrinogen-III synthase [Arthrobacter sp. A2-55]MCU6482350.1 uroporphyrinogen-III synthase [Arthrobacter sp. A2-55]
MNRSPATALPLQGYRIGVTAHRRAGDLIEALERRGARVLHAPALRIAPVADDEVLLAEIAAVIEAAPDIVLVTTAYGMRRWCEAADAAGRGEELLAVLARADIYVRGPKARGAVRAAGLDDAGISADETTAALTDMVVAAGVRGKTVAVQVHGFTDVAALARLRDAGADLLTVTPYRWVNAESGDRLSQLIDAVADRELDVITFTSAPAADAVLSAAAESGRGAEFLAALRGSELGAPPGPGALRGAAPGAPANPATAAGGQAAVVSAAVGPVTAAPLLAAGITPLVPERFRMGALIRLVCEHLEAAGSLRVETGAGLLEVRGSVLLAGGIPVPLAPAPLHLLRALMAAGGAVRSHAELAAELGPGESDNALHMAVSRLRAALPDPTVVETVVKRGYRLRV